MVVNVEGPELDDVSGIVGLGVNPYKDLLEPAVLDRAADGVLQTPARGRESVKGGQESTTEIERNLTCDPTQQGVSLRGSSLDDSLDVNCAKIFVGRSRLIRD